ncbi:SDR family NAD(P)-dependent oxidoreductase [Chitinophaga rhizophila]|uniref:SDR family NAD(P)-dependent oxidoreductase n=1 Tax=Chitinophaga rhizophila TaxID=2866212 RepID=A0ABS7GKN2_9BACT|nr:SDR family NAD(P)-dependent oxidoreductase [Chitinophaga rhizophila]MBW8688279.1 SDR family NAD(P)-dependent oxidoreductase [Chitinophaga rhizophila]
MKDPKIITDIAEYLDQEKPVWEKAAHHLRISLRPVMAEINEWWLRLLCRQLTAAGLFNDNLLVKAVVLQLPGWNPQHNRWLDETISILQREGYLREEGKGWLLTEKALLQMQNVWELWQQQKTGWTAAENFLAWIDLTDATLQALPAVLTGGKPATDIIFPGSSMHLVEGVYRNNQVSDLFNEVLANCVIAYVRQRIEADPSARIRILEIGAGTGGTSALVFKQLEPYVANIATYCYTDISKAFLFHAENTFSTQAPYLETALLNIEQPLAMQDVAIGSYDLVIAANVLHATRNIRFTLRNAKALLVKRGLLLLNEITAASLFPHLTMGLLEGWWLHEDTVLRIPGSPGLTTQSWQSVLQSEGFTKVKFPATSAAEWGMQIIVSESNGVIRQPVVNKERTAAAAGQEIMLEPVVVPSAPPVTAVLTAHIKDTVVEKIAQSLKMPIDKIRSDRPFADYGLDSITGVSLVQKINKALAIDLQTTTLFDYSTVNELTGHIVETYGQQLQPSAPVIHASITPPVSAGTTPNTLAPVAERISTDGIAVIGISGRYADSPDVNALWQHIAAGHNLVKDISRWDLSKVYDPEEDTRNYCKRGSSLDEIDLFDPVFFNISGLEATYMDPQQRLFLEECWKALEHAGYAGQVVNGLRCGVYVGYGGNDYARLLGDNPPPQALWGNQGAALPARIAYYLNLQGPAITVDTACSSSLVSIHLACQALRSGETDMALAGGVAVATTPAYLMALNRAGMLSPTGTCYTFDDRADGFVVGEGVGVVVLKRLSDAQRDGDYIYGVIRGSGINQDGTSNGITAPSALSQERLEKQVYDRFNIDPAGIQLVEAHGTATRLGDPIEYQALTKAFRHYTGKTHYCAIGSVKTNIGHTTAAAGVAGVLKVLQALQHQQLPPSLHYENGNSNIRFEGSPFYVNTTLQPWTVPAGEIRRAAVSSFGLSGTNAHMVIEESTTPLRVHTPRPGYLIVLSAQNVAALKQQVINLRDYAVSHPGNNAGNISYTLLLGRKHFNHRLAFVAPTTTVIADVLSTWMENKQLASVYTGVLPDSDIVERSDTRLQGQEAIRLCNTTTEDTIYLAALQQIAGLYVQGYTLAYNQLFPEGEYNRITLPAYPFTRQRYWVDAQRDAVVKNADIPAKPTDTLLLQPTYTKATATLRQVVDVHIILLCTDASGLTEAIRSAYPAATILAPDYAGLAIAERYFSYATLLLEQCQSLKSSALIQVLVSEENGQHVFTGLQGFLKTAAAEYPAITTQLLSAETTAALHSFVPALLHYTAYPLVKYSDEFYVPGWEPLPHQKSAPVVWKEEGVYIITGGAGGLGWLFAKDIASHISNGVIVLTGRRELSAEKVQQLKTIQTDRLRVEYRQTDITNKTDTMLLVQDIKHRYGRLDGIIHSAGVIQDGLISSKSTATLYDVLAPKVKGLIHLKEAAAILAPEWIVCCSSVSAITGNPGQADYAAGNGFMDAIAGDNVISINWPLWKDGGMQIPPDALALLQEEGLQPMATEEGMKAFHQIVQGKHRNVLVLHGDTALLQRGGHNTQIAAASPSVNVQQADNDQLYEKTLSALKRLFAEETRLDVSHFSADAPLDQYGIDSVLTTALNRRLQKVFGKISRTLLFEYQNLGALTNYFLQHHAQQCVEWSGLAVRSTVQQQPIAKEPNSKVTRTGSDQSLLREPIAIIGISGRYPQAENLDVFWQNLAAGKDCITEIPAERWSIDGFYEADRETAIASGKSYNKWGGFLENFSAFDPVFFNITPTEARDMDPQERIFIEVCWEALENAGYSKTLLEQRHQRKVGVFTGITKTGFDLYGPALWQQGVQQYPHTSFGSMANRISYLLNLQGPSMPVDTMCSSSLTALHEACEHLLRGECEMAITGGVNLYLHPSSYVALSAYRMVAADARSKSFGAGGDGFVPGEGAGAVVLKRLSQAEADGDHIYAVIRATGVNHGGRTKGYTVPNPVAQAELIRKTLDKAGVDAATVSYIEAHGTGTELGDPIEVTGITQAFAKDTANKQYCAVGAVKSNIGHLEAAAGIAGLTKVVLQMQHRQLVPSLHARELNPNIDFEDTPLFVQQTLTEWKRPLISLNGDLKEYPRIAGLSSFGAGGANAHAIIEEYTMPADQPHYDKPVVIILSAIDDDRLLEVVKRLFAAVTAHKYTDPQLAGIAFTLQTGREHFSSRIAFVAESIDMLADRLNAYIQKGAQAEQVYTGHVKRYQENLLATLLQKEVNHLLPGYVKDGAYHRIAALWVNGVEPDWHLLYTNAVPRRVPLPAYPFLKERYWFDTLVTHSQAATPSKVIAKQAPIHTMLLSPGRVAAAHAVQAYIPGVHHVLLINTPDALVTAYRHYFQSAQVEILQADSYTSVATAVLTILQQLIRQQNVLLQVVCQKSDLLYTGLSGMLLSAVAEQPAIAVQLIVTDSWEMLEPALPELGQYAAYRQLYLKKDGIYTNAWNYCPEDVKTGSLWKDKGVYLITGGAGGLGLLLAKDAAAKSEGATIILAGRSPLTADKQALVQSLSATGTTIVYEQADIADEDQTHRLVTDIINRYGGLDGIIHSAGVIRDSFIIKKTITELITVLQPKVQGLINLDKATAQLPLDWLICFSSLSAVAGNAGQSDYAAANGFLDAFAVYRNQLARTGDRSGHTLSINWPLWEHGGMQVDAATRRQLKAIGIVPLDNAAGIRALETALKSKVAQVVVLHGASDLPEKLLNNINPLSRTVMPGKQIDNQLLHDKTLSALKELFAAQTRLDITRIDAEEPLESYGIDSILVAQLNRHLIAVFGNISRTLFFEYLTLGALAKYLASTYPDKCIEWTGITAAIDLPVEDVPRPLPVPVVHPGNEREPIAIIGISGRYPQADNIRTFWENLKTGKDCVTELPEDRWPLQDFYEGDKEQAIAIGKSYSKWGGFLQHFAAFDPVFFHLSRREAQGIDPQERIFLEVCWEALEDAGYSRTALGHLFDGRVGVFAGITKTGFDLYGPKLWEQGDRLYPHTSFSSVANRISYLLNLQGPSMPIDTMCSSSLTAIHEACEYLLRGDCAMAIAGGVNIYVHPSTYISLSAYRMLAADGRSKSFGIGGDGFVPGEGAGVLILKRLSDAEKDGDHIYGLIKGTAINHGGKTNGYTVPNPNAQAAVISDALRKAGVHARTVSYFEAHGTGTELGDPIEVTGITRAFEKDTEDRQYCALGTVKSNIGHLEAAAGVAGLTKILLQMKHRQIAPSLHAQVLNPNIVFEASPLLLQQQLGLWERPTVTINGETKEYPLIAGISSFGAGGSNAHAVIQEYIPAAKQIAYFDGPVIIILSAPHPDKLRMLAERLLAHIDDEGYSSQHLYSIAYTLQSGREYFSERLAIVTDSITHLQQSLKDYLAGITAAHILSGSYNKYQKEIGVSVGVPTAYPSLVAAKAFNEIANRWLQGEDPDWKQLYTPGTPQRISLPVYPFTKERIWWADDLSSTTQATMPENNISKPTGISLTNVPAEVSESIDNPPPAYIPETAARTQEVVVADTKQLERELTKTFAEVLLLDISEVDPDRPFVDMGLDSIVGVEWIRIVNRQFGTAMPATKVYDHPTVREFAAFLATLVKSESPATIPEPVTIPEKTIVPEQRPLGKEFGLVVDGVKLLDELVLDNWKVPAPKSGEVLIQVKASAVNFPDVMCVKGLYPTMPSYPFVPGFEVAGIVAAIGTGVTDFIPGDEVVALTGVQLGGHANYVCTPVVNVVRKPVNWTFEEACSLPVVFGAVYHAFELAGLSVGDKVLIQTATGGCGLIALQLAHLYGCEVYGTSSKEEKLDILRQIGIKHTLNYKDDFDKEIKELTAGEGVNVVLNLLSGEPIQKGINSLAPRGRYLELAVQGLKTSMKLDLSNLVENQSFYSVDLRRLAFMQGVDIRQLLQLMVEMAEHHQIVPIVSRIYPVKLVTDALKYVESGQHIGKVVVSHNVSTVKDLTKDCIDALRTHRLRTVGGQLQPLGRKTAPAVLPVGTTRVASAPVMEGIAIIGMSGQFPQAANLDIYWDNLVNGRDCITTIPEERWPADAFYDPDITVPGKSNSKWMGIVPDADKFDPLFFNISPAEAALMDPQQRLFLENCWHCIEDAGIRPADLWGSRCGVYVGCAAGDYDRRMTGDALNAQGLMGCSPSILSARISYLLNLKGPCKAIDTACSSSLVAIADACDSLLLGSSDLALAGGISMMLSPMTNVVISKAGMLSPTGHCYTFDARADGFVPGEGTGVVLLKRLSDAERDGDHIYGVIRGWGVNQDGKTNGITAPSVKSQIALEKEVYERFAIDPATITLVEAHGTGTLLGDPIEVEALTTAFRQFTPSEQYCALGSVKSNIGHLLTASGVAGVLKVLLSMQHRQLPPTIHFNNLNQHINLTGSPFYINDRLQPWEVANGVPRRAAVSAFGFSGTNAHIVIDEYVNTYAATRPETPVLIILSAATLERLQTYAGLLKEFVGCHENYQLVDIAYTLQTGRNEMLHRMAVTVSTVAQLLLVLEEFSAHGKAAGVYTGIVRKNAEELPLGTEDLQALLSTWIQQQQYDKIAALWVKGAQIDWHRLYAVRPSRISLPGYPFERESYWIPATFPTPGTTVNSEPVAMSVALPGDVYTFREDWKPAAAVAGLIRLSCVVCFITGSHAQDQLTAWARTQSPATRLIFVSKGTKWQEHTAAHYTIDADATNDYERVFRAVTAAYGTIDGVFYGWPAEDGGCIPRYGYILSLLQGLHRAAIQPSRIVLGAIIDGNRSRSYVDSWIGFERSLGFILPETKLYVVGDSAGNLQTIFEALFAETAESALHIDSVRYTTHVSKIVADHQAPVFKQGGTYLITGGAGGLGRLLAQYITSKYPVNLALIGRSAPDASFAALKTALQQNGSQVIYLQADVTDEASLTMAIDTIHKQLGAINGVIHAAGVMGNELLTDTTVAAFDKVLLPKVQGVLLLDKILSQQQPEFICHFSSSAAILGDFGSASYAVANRFQTAYSCLQQRPQGAGKTVVINWPLWREGGMHLPAEGSTALYLQTSGQRLLERQEGLQLFERLLSQSGRQYLVLAGQEDRINTFLRKTEAPTSSLEEKIEQDLKQHISILLKIREEKLNLQDNLADYGFDSISLAALARQLSEHFKLNITPALFFGYSSIGKLVSYFADNHRQEMTAYYTQAQSGQVTPVVRTADLISEQPVTRQDRPATADEPIAIIGMSGRFPGARSIEKLWQLLLNGREAIEEIPPQRFDWKAYYGDPVNEPGKTNGKWCGIIPGVREFDAAFFNISPKEAADMDPRQRLLLQESWNALEDAGYGPDRIRDEKIGMFVGAEDGDYSMLLNEGNITGNHNGILAARMAYFLNFNGPVMTINTACSSGLVAVHQACQSLRTGECDTAMAAGVNLLLTPAGFVGMGQAGMLSPDGTCYAFDKRANGLVPGEAVAVVVLKRLSAALADGDPVMAVIRGSGINYDGHSNGITAPNAVAQAALLKGVYDRNGIHPEDIGYIVSHGTGTRIGDPVEVQALDTAFAGYTAKRQYCAVTSVKSNIGHTFAASGLVSMLTLVKSLQEGVIPASLHCEQDSDYINWKNSCFYINKENRNWSANTSGHRLGAVSAFGMSGTNAHLVLESYAAEEKEVRSLSAYLLVLSAKTEQALTERARSLLAWLYETPASPGLLPALGYTLQTGRFHFRYRCALIVHDLQDGIQQLQSMLEGKHPPRVFRAAVPAGFSPQPSLQHYMEELLREYAGRGNEPSGYDEQLHGLATLYCQGYDIDWDELYRDEIPGKIHLPGYPFERTEYWTKEKSPGNVPQAAPLTLKATAPASTSREPDNLHYYDRLLDEVIDDTIDIESAILKIMTNPPQV